MIGVDSGVLQRMATAPQEAITSAYDSFKQGVEIRHNQKLQNEKMEILKADNQRAQEAHDAEMADIERLSEYNNLVLQKNIADLEYQLANIGQTQEIETMRREGEERGLKMVELGGLVNRLSNVQDPSRRESMIGTMLEQGDITQEQATQLDNIEDPKQFSQWFANTSGEAHKLWVKEKELALKSKYDIQTKTAEEQAKAKYGATKPAKVGKASIPTQTQINSHRPATIEALKKHLDISDIHEKGFGSEMKREDIDELTYRALGAMQQQLLIADANEQAVDPSVVFNNALQQVMTEDVIENPETSWLNPADFDYSIRPRGESRFGTDYATAAQQQIKFLNFEE